MSALPAFGPDRAKKETSRPVKVNVTVAPTADAWRNAPAAAFDELFLAHAPEYDTAPTFSCERTTLIVGPTDHAPIFPARSSGLERNRYVVPGVSSRVVELVAA